MFRKNLSYLIFCLSILLQGLLVCFLYYKSIEINGDVVNYLKIMAGDINIDYDIEPISLLLFKLIGLFPLSFHLILLITFIILLCIIESWIVYKETQGSCLWLVFFVVAIVPFFHTINLRTGFGMFFLLVSYRRKSIWALILTPLFHASFIPVLLGIKFRISFKNLMLIIFLILVLGLLMYNLIFSKLETYYSYYVDGASIVGVLAEIFLLVTFSYFLSKKYTLNTSILWYRIFFFIIIISIVSVNLAIISSRFITLSYLILLMIRLSSNKIEKSKQLTINNIFFYILFILLIFFRIYRVLTMFGIVSF